MLILKAVLLVGCEVELCFNDLLPEGEEFRGLETALHGFPRQKLMGKGFR